MIKLVYLDVCTLCRPFDDQSYLRIRMETEAVNLILAKVKEGIYQMVVSPVHIKEIEAIPDGIERIQLLSLLEKYGIKAEVNLKQVKKKVDMPPFWTIIMLHFNFFMSSCPPFLNTSIGGLCCSPFVLGLQ